MKSWSLSGTIYRRTKYTGVPGNMGIWTFKKFHQSPPSPQGGGYLSMADLVISHAMAKGSY